VSLQNLSDEEVIVPCNVLKNQRAVTSHKGQTSFREFRAAIHPNMKWNWMVEVITEELQLFYEAFVAGKRPKLAIEMPPQHGKSLAAEDFIAWVAGKQRSWKTIYASYSDNLGTLRRHRLLNTPCQALLTVRWRRSRVGRIGTPGLILITWEFPALPGWQ
jgi:hypothetical protein